ncbi:MAG TPA: PfkB family carbohydrate kinase, partial [Microbacteriaceae bacterium]|nr:PfkB family carbohydrate kinase [Microbacteriaceae bacterium]
VSQSTLRAADPLIVNEHEARALLHASAGADASATAPGAAMGIPQALAAARTLAEGFAASAVVTLGQSGAVAAAGGDAWHEPAPKTDDVVDSTGAGDAFVGALAACLAFGANLADAVRCGVAAGTAATGAAGTVASYGRLPRLHPTTPAGTP